MQGFTGGQLVTADIAVGRAGLPVRIFSIHVISGTASVVNIYSGASDGGTLYIKETGTVNTGKTFTYGKYGMLFPVGAFVDVDANVVSVLVNYAQEL